jgi:hypothetical protein
LSGEYVACLFRKENRRKDLFLRIGTRPVGHENDHIEEKIMAVKGKFDRRKFKIYRRRCHGRMTFEKFYGQHSSFFGWHCVMCGDILDPVILLHRISQDANVSIPEREEEIISLIMKYMSVKPKAV